jgi:hypothetical protein
MVREFSSIGPCIQLGEFVKRTENTITFIERDGSRCTRGGQRLKNGLIHTLPCRSCRDHPESQYPNGYEN